MPPETEKAWMAGIFEGEGGARIYRTKARKELSYWPAVQAISNTDPLLIKRVTAFLDQLGLRGSYWLRKNSNGRDKPGRGHHSLCFEVRIGSTKSIPIFLNAILPYLTGSKKTQAELILAFIELRNSRPKRYRNQWTGKLGDECFAADEALYRQQQFRPKAALLQN